MIDTIAQCGAAILGVSAIWFVGRKEQWRRWGYIFGALSQPFWYYTFVHNHQYILVLLSAFYTYGWLQGIYFYWLKGESK